MKQTKKKKNVETMERKKKRKNRYAKLNRGG